MKLKNKLARILGIKRAPGTLPATVTCYPPGHFYSPLPDLAEFSEPNVPCFDTSLRDLPGINLNEKVQFGLLESLLPHYKRFSSESWSDLERTNKRFHFDQCYFKEADAMSLYGILSHYKPGKVIEVGSGHSSALMLDTADADPGWQPQLTFIEPYPDRLNSVLKETDAKRTRIIQNFVQRVPMDQFTSLDAGDLLFIDSSHVSKIGSDVNFLFLDVLPKLKAGVIIHVHDIFWPFEYPHEWIMQGRAWNETYLLRALLVGSDMYEIIFWNSWMGLAAKETLSRNAPWFLKDTGGSIYLRKLR